MTTTVSVHLNFPVEWERLFNQADPEDDDDDLIDRTFAGDAWRDWVRDNTNLRYLYRESSDSFETRDHSTPGYEGENMFCHTYLFEMHINPSQPFRRPVRRELRLSVPAPTKLPLP